MHAAACGDALFSMVPEYHGFPISPGYVVDLRHAGGASQPRGHGLHVQQSPAYMQHIASCHFTHSNIVALIWQGQGRDSCRAMLRGGYGSDAIDGPSYECPPPGACFNYQAHPQN